MIRKIFDVVHCRTNAGNAHVHCRANAGNAHVHRYAMARPEGRRVLLVSSGCVPLLADSVARHT
eukprot:101905-Chlamydomonas_euryale.AAC.1